MIRLPSFLAAFLCLLWIALASSAIATAQTTKEGILNAISFEPLPESTSFLVRPLDDTNENLAIKAKFDAALAADGFSVTTGESRFVLSFETKEEIGAGPAPQPQGAIRFQGQTGRTSTSDRRNVPKLLEAPRDGTKIYRSSRYRIDATIDDKVEGKRLWQGWAIAGVDEHSHLFLAKAMVPAIVDSIGSTVRQKPFQLQ